MASNRSSGNSRTPTTRTGYRSAETGQFITPREAARSPATTVKERVPLPGRGETRLK